MSYRYFIENGEGQREEVESYEAYERWQTTNARYVVQTFLDRRTIEISTVFDGIVIMGPPDPPTYYETRIFGGPHADYEERYFTRAEALAGHLLLVRRCLNS